MEFLSLIRMRTWESAIKITVHVLFYKKLVYKKLDPTKAKFPYVKSFLISVFYTNSVGLSLVLIFL